jgi:hypothetical protein
VAFADGDNSYSFERPEEHSVEYPSMTLEAKEATLALEENRVTSSGEEFAIVPSCESAKPLTHDDESSTPGLTQVVHIRARAGLIVQRLRAVR